MRTTSHRSVRGLLVTSGALALGLGALAPVTVWADAGDRGDGPSVERSEDRGAGTIWVCHLTASETNPWVAIEVSEGSSHHDEDLELGDEWLEVLGAPPDAGRPGELTEEQAGAIAAACATLSAAQDDAPTGTDDAPTGTDRSAGTPATPATPVPAAQPRPVVVISTDTVSRPTPAVPAPSATPAMETAGSAVQNEVLGSVTTRTPSADVGAPDPGARASVLAATGFDHTSILAALGSGLVLSGLALLLASRTRMRPPA